MSILTIVFIFSLLSFSLGILLGFSIYIYQVDEDPIIEVINELLPQTQCAQCGYSGCYSYAKGIVENNENINKCIPGGNNLILKIAETLNIKISPEKLNLKDNKMFHTTVLIDEKNCVGCSKCAFFCPVDAIVGAPNFLHTVLQESCTGCNICLLHCPTNCITIKKKHL